MYTLLVTGDVPGATTYFNPLLQQTIINCTSGTRPSSPTDGMCVYETDTRYYRSWNSTLASWVTVFSNTVTAITPVLTGSSVNPTLGTGSTAVGWWSRSQANMIDFTFAFKFGTSGVSAGTGTYNVNLPVTALSVMGSLFPEAVGGGMIRDDSSGVVKGATVYLPGSATAQVAFHAPDASGNAVFFANTAPWTWAAQDYIFGNIRYRAAS